ncbi:MAG TPA: CehA/McbA family metallohydrolase [Gemmatimonadales bacterium]|nr:CehA/McbA family metallohydrolase [Gemmatimonadales bacterium]
MKGVTRTGRRVIASCIPVLLLGGWASLAAQREPVLQQIKLPHSYYYREMYLPQVTSGPSSATWSPDGKTLIYSMQGDLWRQRVGDSVAEQLTTGPGYSYQPDWSPDGTRVVYSSYHHDMVELRVLDLRTLVSGSLVNDGAVNVDPRWSPDGGRIAYVSTAYQGRFHVWIAEVQPDGDSARSGVRLVRSFRLTEDHDSGLPRYYYSVYDHYLSPTWSPDGRDLILVSNHGRIWGSGGLWRMAAAPGAPMRSIRDEESTWRMRPDWSLDGQRVVYASYIGRPWHQLWLTTADGGEPIPLTFGAFDATNPRWAPDGRHIAYISNEFGNTALYVLEIPGGARTLIVPGRRVYRAPVGRLRINVIDATTGKPLPSRVSVTLPDGRGAAPDDAWRHADDGFDRQERPFELSYFHTPGSSVLTVPAGTASLEVSHGLEYGVARESLAVPAGALTEHTVRLHRLVTLPGWTSGDLHVHMNYAGHYRATPATLAFQARAEDLNVVENLIVNKEVRMPDIAYFTGHSDPISTSSLLLVHDQEFHTSWWGHTGALGLTDHILLPGFAGYAGTAAQSLYPDNATIADLVHRQHGLFGYVHPFDTYPDPFDTTVALTDELPVDVALGKVDYYEVVGFSDHLASSRVWFQLLNCGFRIPAGAGTDAMTNFASLRGPVGTNRVYVQSGTPLDRARWYSALRAGKSFATNGPILQLSVSGQGIGGEVALDAGRRRLPVRVFMRSIVPIDHLELIRNGEVAARIPLRGDRTAADTSFTVEVEHSGWFVLRAYSDRAIEPVLDIYPYGSTSPVYVTIAGAPMRSAVDAAYFVRWLDRLTSAAGSHQGWNTPEEKREVLTRIQAAREEFERRGAH